jgi:hypothetical protein
MARNRVGDSPGHGPRATAIVPAPALKLCNKSDLVGNVFFHDDDTLGLAKQRELHKELAISLSTYFTGCPDTFSQ